MAFHPALKPFLWLIAAPAKCRWDPLKKDRARTQYSKRDPTTVFHGGKNTSDLLQDKPGFGLNGISLPFLAAAAYCSVHLKPDKPVFFGLFIFSTAAKANNPWSCAAAKLMVHRDN